MPLRAYRLLAALVCVIAVSTASAIAQPAAPASKRLFADSRLVILDRISVEVVGTGPDLILVPGLASPRSVWKATAEHLRSHYRLHLVQVAGFAGEPARGNGAGEVVVPTAEAIDAYIVQNRLAPAVLIGHSLGGTMALYLAEHHPEHLRKVLIVDALPLFGLLMAGPGATPETLHALAERAEASTLSATDYASMLEPHIAGMVVDPARQKEAIGWSVDSDRSVVARAIAEDIKLDLRPGLGEIRTPITLLYPDYMPAGAPAGVMDRSYGAAYAPVPHIMLKRIDHSLHFIMFDQPAAFDAALDVFLAS